MIKRIIKALSSFKEMRYNDTFNRHEKIITIGVHFPDGVYYQTLRMPLNTPLTEEQAKNMIETMYNINP